MRRSEIGMTGYMEIVSSTPKKIKYEFLFFGYFWSVWQQLSFDQYSHGGILYKIYFMLLMNTFIFLVPKSALDRRLGTLSHYLLSKEHKGYFEKIL